jgi:hypothetical protein
LHGLNLPAGSAAWRSERGSLSRAGGQSLIGLALLNIKVGWRFITSGTSVVFQAFVDFIERLEDFEDVVVLVKVNERSPFRVIRDKLDLGRVHHDFLVHDRGLLGISMSQFDEWHKDGSAV